MAAHHGRPSGAAHRWWKGGRSTAHHGYILIRQPNGRYRYEHRLIAEKALGRPLARNEVVHHIDENGANNSPSNLIIMSASYHRWLHLQTEDPDAKARRLRNVSLSHRTPAAIARRVRNTTKSWATLSPEGRAAKTARMLAGVDQERHGQTMKAKWAKLSSAERSAIAQKSVATRRARRVAQAAGAPSRHARPANDHQYD